MLLIGWMIAWMLRRLGPVGPTHLLWRLWRMGEAGWFWRNRSPAFMRTVYRSRRLAAAIRNAWGNG